MLEAKIFEKTKCITSVEKSDKGPNVFPNPDNERDRCMRLIN